MKQWRFREDTRQCLIDPTHKTYVRPDGEIYWTKYQDGYLCRPCARRLIDKPRRPSRAKKIKTPRQKKEKDTNIFAKRIRFLGKRIFLSFNPRNGHCKLCQKKIEVDFKRSSMHHLIYVPIMPWAGTLEVCNSCHIMIHDLNNHGSPPFP